MARQGFVSYSKEWWHFSLPGTARAAYDFPIGPARSTGGSRRTTKRQAAALGGLGGMRGLGMLHAYGLGVTKDYAQARNWYE